MNIENEHILVNALDNGINLFLGAGFSTRAFDSSKRNLPLASVLRDELLKEFDIPDFRELPLPQLCTYLQSTNRDAFLSYLVSRFTVASFNPAYGKLSSIAAKWIFTTNIDDLVFHIFKPSGTHYINDIDSRGPVYGDAKAVHYVALHGCVRHPERGFIFAAEDLASAFAEDHDRWHFFTQSLQERPTLFIGYGVNDAAVLNCLRPKAVAGVQQKKSGC